MQSYVGYMYEHIFVYSDTHDVYIYMDTYGVCMSMYWYVWVYMNVYGICRDVNGYMRIHERVRVNMNIFEYVCAGMCVLG